MEKKAYKTSFKAGAFAYFRTVYVIDIFEKAQYNEFRQFLKGDLNMKGFLKFLLAIGTVFATVIGALAIFDKLSNKNRIEGDYLECDSEDFTETEE